MLYVFRCLVDDDIPLNDGCLRRSRIVVPPGTFLSPAPGAAVVAGNAEVSQATCNALFGALGALACSQGTMNNLLFGDATRQYYETICGGAGAGPGFDGASAVQTHMTNTRMTDPEVLELRYPVRVERSPSAAVRRRGRAWRRRRGAPAPLSRPDDGGSCFLAADRPSVRAAWRQPRRLPAGNGSSAPAAAWRRRSAEPTAWNSRPATW